MAEISSSEKPTEEFSCSSWDRNDSHQQEVSRILKDFKMDFMGIISIGKDGVLRSLTVDGTIIDAQGLSKVSSLLHRYTMRLTVQLLIRYTPLSCDCHRVTG